MSTTTDFSSLAKKWPSTFVAREKVSDFSGGILHPRTMANYDSRGDGCPGMFKIGRKVAYPVNELINWMAKRQTGQNLPDAA